MQRSELEEIEESIEPIMVLREQLLENWKKHDPRLLDLEGFRKHFNKAYDAQLKKTMSAEEKQFDEWATTLAIELRRPFYLFPSSWSKDAPKPVRDRILPDRLIQMMQGIHGLATYSEVVYYMYGRTMDAPMGREWTNIYLHCGKMAMPAIREAMKTDSDFNIHDLGSQEEAMLLKLRRWIWEKSVKSLKEIDKAQRNKEIDEFELDDEEDEVRCETTNCEDCRPELVEECMEEVEESTS